MRDREIDLEHVRPDSADRSAEQLRARDTVLHGIDRGLFDAAGARDILEHLGLLLPLRVPPKRRTS